MIMHMMDPDMTCYMWKHLIEAFSLSILYPSKNGIFQILIFHSRISVLWCALWDQNYVNSFFFLLNLFSFAVILVFCVCSFLFFFIDNCLSYCPVSFDNYCVCSLMYGLWLPLWYRQVFQDEFIFNVQSIFWQSAIYRIFPFCCAFLICLSILCKKITD